jgi:hypothetical protein
MRSNEEKLILLYVALTGASEAMARSVIMHLDLGKLESKPEGNFDSR